MANKKLLYHITDSNNLESILKQGGLLSNSLVSKKGVEYQNIAHTSIQDRRLITYVPFQPNGNLHEYIPFYFAPRSPMIYAIHKGQVEGYEEGQEQLIYFVSRIYIIYNAGLEYVFTDGHPIMWYTDFYKDLRNLDKIDWNVMNSQYWFDTPEDPDRKRRRQAEFLAHRMVSMDLFLGIAVKNEEMKLNVKKILKKYNINKTVLIKTSWYY